MTSPRTRDYVRSAVVLDRSGVDVDGRFWTWTVRARLDDGREVVWSTTSDNWAPEPGTVLGSFTVTLEDRGGARLLARRMRAVAPRPRQLPNPHGLAPGDRVAFTGWGGEVRLMDAAEMGVVTRINRSGHPVILIERHSHEWKPRTLTDRYGCAVRTS